MYTEIEARNFKAFGQSPARLDLGRLTILLGQNNSGKTTVLEAIALLAQTARQNTGPNWLGPWVDFGPSGSAAWFKSDTALELEIALQYGNDSSLKNWLRRSMGSDQQLRIESFGYRVAHRGSTNEWRHEISLADVVLAKNELVITKDSFRTRAYSNHLTLRGIEVAFAPNANAGAVLSPDLFAGRPIQHATLGDAGAETAMVWASSLTQYLRDALRQRVFMVGADRGPKEEKPERSLDDSLIVGRRGEHTLSVLSVLFARPEYAEQSARIQHWAEVFGMGKLRGGWAREEMLRAGYVDEHTGTPLNLQSAGFGSQQILPVIVQLFSAPVDSLVMIEEPEISLHPEAQVHLVRMFAEAIALGKQLIVTTHSQTLLLALSEAANSMRPGDVSVYHMARGLEGAGVKKLELDANWSLRGWVPSFSEVERELLRKWMANVHGDLAKE